MIIEENKLIQLAQSGDRNAFDMLVKGCASKIYNLVMRLTNGNSALSEDIAQDAFVKAFLSIKEFKGDAAFSNWVYRIAVNTWKNRVRYEKRRLFMKHFSYNESIDSGKSDPNKGGQEGDYQEPEDKDSRSPEEEFELKSKKETILKALDSLGNTAKIIIVLRDVEEKSYEEICGILGISKGTVKSRLSRARDALREKLKMLEEDG